MEYKFGYKVSRRLGGGRFSDVYEVFNESSGKLFALKVCEPDDERPPHNIRNETSILNKMKNSCGRDEAYSSNVIRLQASFITPIEMGLLFDIYPVGLRQLLASRCKTRSHFNSDGSISKVSSSQLTLPEIRHIFKGCLSGLAFIHSCGIIHRDINPNNILFADTESLDPVIIDFGISYEEPTNNGLEPPDKKFTDIATGYYKAPELLMSVRDYGNKIDVWSMAIVLSLLASENGHEPYDEDAARSDLALLSNIVTVFGSPPSDWEDCKNSRTFVAMNESFFAKDPLPATQVVPKIANDPTLLKVFQGMTKYPSKERLTAQQAYDILA